MEVCLFMIATAKAETPAAPSTPVNVADIEALAATMPGLRRLVTHVPVAGGASDPYLKIEPPPICAMQFYFDELGDLEATLLQGGATHGLLDSQRFPAFAGQVFTQQVMAVRRFPVLEPKPEQAGVPRCTYLVSYEGPAQDMNAWLGHYVDSHPTIMARFPGIREIEIYTCVDYRGDHPALRSTDMQRNKVVFDSPAALDASLASPVRHEMRADFHNFPPFGGRNFHYPMISHKRNWPR